MIDCADRCLTSEPIEPGDAIAHLALPDARSGASVVFAGIVRADEADGRQVTALTYEAYEAMAESEINKLTALAASRWPVTHITVRHRVGRVEVGSIALLVVVASPHRAEAYAASQFIIERIKQDVPIWKHEHSEENRHALL